MVDRSFWKVIKEHQFGNDVAIYFLVRDDFYYVVVEDTDETPVWELTYCSFAKENASYIYKRWHSVLLKNKGDYTKLDEYQE